MWVLVFIQLYAYVVCKRIHSTQHTHPPTKAHPTQHVPSPQSRILVIIQRVLERHHAPPRWTSCPTYGAKRRVCSYF